MNGISRAKGLASAILLGVAVTGPAQAAITTITFDEVYVDNEEVVSSTNPYIALGATFDGTLAVVKSVGDLNNLPDADGRYLHFDKSPVDVTVTLDQLAEYLSFDFRRPGSEGTIFVSIFSGVDLVHDFGQIGWDPAVTPDWVTFEYFGDFGSYDRVLFEGGSKYVIDNLAFGVQPVPLPPAVLLLGSGLALMHSRRLLGRRAARR